jgi:serine/threonine-protein kinase
MMARAGSADERARLEDLRSLMLLDGDASWPASADTTVGVPAPLPPAAQRRWGHLELLDEIGHGAQGVVYRAWETRLAREVALKLRTADDSDSIEEARHLARVAHPHVVTVYGADRLDGEVGIWMELLKGRTLDAMLREHGAFSMREAIGIGVEICGAVAAIHAAGLIHRDLKAQNVMREPGGRLVVMDVGASVVADAESEAQGPMVGTPLYMAPELFEGAPPGVASDIYALGVLLYRLVTAAFPIDAHTVADVRRAHQARQLRPLRDVRADLAPAFVRVVEQCLSHDPATRLQSAAALERALQQIDAVPPAAVGWRRRRTIVLGGVLLAAIGAIGIGMGWWLARRLANGEDTSATPIVVSPEQYRLMAGYEELAFVKRLDDPTASGAALRSALAQIRTTLPGQHGVFVPLYARLARTARRSGDLAQARIDAQDSAAHVAGSIGDDHPYAAVLAMELARNAHAAADHGTAAAETRRALDIRARVLGLAGLGQKPAAAPDSARIENALRSGRSLEDSDHDGVVDAIEAAVGLDPRSVDTDSDGVVDGDEDHDHDGVTNRLALGAVGDPFLTWTHFGAHDPRPLAWQAAPQFPAVQHPDQADPPSWLLTATHSLTLFHHLVNVKMTQGTYVFGTAFQFNNLVVDEVIVQSEVPEPASLLLLGGGLAALAARRRRQK